MAEELTNKIHSKLSEYNRKKKDINIALMQQKLLIIESISNCKTEAQLEKYLKEAADAFNISTQVERIHLLPESFNTLIY